MSQRQQAWFVMFAAYFAGVAIAVNQAKVPPIMQVLMANLHMDTVTGGWMMSALAVAGIILGIPSAFVLGRLGPKATVYRIPRATSD